LTKLKVFLQELTKAITITISTTTTITTTTTIITTTTTTTITTTTTTTTILLNCKSLNKFEIKNEEFDFAFNFQPHHPHWTRSVIQGFFNNVSSIHK
jgi:hypothetical protein